MRQMQSLTTHNFKGKNRFVGIAAKRLKGVIMDEKIAQSLMD